MTTLNFLLLSILYFWGSSTALSMGIGYYTLYRPIISGMITGLILGDVKLGILAGSVVNIMYIDFISTGGSLKGDQCLTAIIAASVSIIFKISSIESAAIAYPFGYLGIFIWKYRLSINTIFVNKYEEKFNNKLNPSIALFDGLYPQILLYVMSTVVILISFLAVFTFRNLIIKENIEYWLYLFGIFLLNISIINVLLKLKNKYSLVLYASTLGLVLAFKASSFLMTLFVIIIVISLSYKDVFLSITSKLEKHDNRILNKRDLFYSWFIWMNFSHACYNYERLQGMAYAHSMKNIIKKLYKDNSEIVSTINKYTEFFNTEPNIGTPIHGYIIYLEEEKSLGNKTIEISYIKKGMMGIAAGLGDSFTQVVLSPLFISISLMLSLDNEFFVAMVPIVLLGIIIIYISYTGWMSGYYNGRQSLINRINLVKKSKVKLKFPLIFGSMLGVITAKLIELNYRVISNNSFDIIAVLVISIIFIIAEKIKQKKNLR
ncbi:PTS system mannose-specific IID component [Sedimentibacter acidaminivorans]|uniref:PTS system mannose-specific IID component n=1 Tax=Sedimentibacter acidaminivorans TaxID=913099 RepID=A0ABS4GBB0_9FIRM|nr:PTS system mannose/fructose/sorbose family transporter subunit IID [Sedimentibacter acidaminivorans]MBP1924974.1 PTS system mannose-specific IID component [Sedimentibacter acidaminivorans]